MHLAKGRIAHNPDTSIFTSLRRKEDLGTNNQLEAHWRTVTIT